MRQTDWTRHRTGVIWYSYNHAYPGTELRCVPTRDGKYKVEMAGARGTFTLTLSIRATPGVRTAWSLALAKKYAVGIVNDIHWLLSATGSQCLSTWCRVCKEVTAHDATWALSGIGDGYKVTLVCPGCQQRMDRSFWIRGGGPVEVTP